MQNQPKKAKMQGKTSSHRRAVTRSLVLELIRAERLQTTPTKAKILKQEFDRLVVHAKQDNQASQRLVESTLRNNLAYAKLTKKILPRLQETNSGYTMTARTMPRKGDAAEQMIVMIKGYEMQEKKSRLQRVLSRQAKEEEIEKKKGVAGRLRNVTKGLPTTRGKKHESAADTRRVST